VYDGELQAVTMTETLDCFKSCVSLNMNLSAVMIAGLVWLSASMKLTYIGPSWAMVGVRVRSVSGARHLSRYVTTHPGQLSLAIPLWVGAKGGDVLWLGIKGRYGLCVGVR